MTQPAPAPLSSAAARLPTELTFDLSGVQANQIKLLSGPRWIAVVGAIVLLLVDFRFFAVRGLSLGQPLLLLEILITLSLAGILVVTAAYTWAPGPVTLYLNSEGMRFAFKSGRSQAFRWDEPTLDFSIVDLSKIASSQPGVPLPVPMNLIGIGFWRSFSLSAEAGKAILQVAQERGLALSTGERSNSPFAREYGECQTHVRGKASRRVETPSSSGVSG
jgi:hypothetical protein